MTDYILGVDETGTGAWFGPAVACAVLASVDWFVPGVKNSKSFGANRSKAHLKRSQVYDQLQSQVPFIHFFYEWVWPETIDGLGLGRAMYKAYLSLVRQAREVQPTCEVVLDGNIKLHGVQNFRSFPKADATVPTVSAASILAKVERDRWVMTEGDSAFPQYGLIDHVGYGTEAHAIALEKYGPCPLHRFSFRSIAQYGRRQDFEAPKVTASRPDLLPDDIVF